MYQWITKPRVKKARQWRKGDEFPGVHKEIVKGAVEALYFVITIHNQRVYLEDGDYVVEEPDGKHYYPVKPDIWESGHTRIY